MAHSKYFKKTYKKKYGKAWQPKKKSVNSESKKISNAKADFELDKILGRN